MINLKNLLSIYCLIFFIFLNTKFVFSKDLYEIEAEKVRYKNKSNIIIAEGNAIAKNMNRRIFADKIEYFKKENIIKTYGNSRFEDSKNILKAENFIYFIKLKKIEAKKNVYFEDSDNNKFYLDSFEFYRDKNFGSGKNIKSKLKDGSYLESNSGDINKSAEITTLNDAKFTTCATIYNKQNKYCPSWSLKSKKITHNKKTKRITHKNSFLRIKNIPILYSPYFSHPDPSVKRQSGFLPPLVKTFSNIGRTFRTPYFWAIADDKDLTLTPIYYTEEKNALLSSYRQVYKEGFLKIESGYSGGYKRLESANRTKGSRNYLFLNYQSNKDNLLLKENILDINIQRVSQRNFLRVNKINTPLFKEDLKTLQNSIEIDSYGNNKKIKILTGVFENLDIDGFNKYTYLIPEVLFDYKIDKFENYSVNLNTFFQAKNVQSEKNVKFRNFLSADSKQYINKKLGTGTIIKFNFLNKNTYNRSLNNRNTQNSNNFATIAAMNSWPLVKFDKKNYQSITPNVFLKYTTGNMNENLTNDNILKYSDVFSMNRSKNLDVPETGLSLGHGINYTSDKTLANLSKFKTELGFGQVIRAARLDNMQNTSSLNNSTSDFSGNVKFKYQENFLNIKKADDKKNKSHTFSNDKNLSFDYNFNLANDFKKFTRNNISLNWERNKLTTNIIFDEKEDHVGNERTGYIKLKKILKDNYFLSYEGKKNLLNDKSEFHNISLNFENDCILTTLTFSKSFYEDNDITSSKYLILNVVIKPFGDGIAPNLSNFLD